MFRRRVRSSLQRKIREFVWPRAGWDRSTRYVVYRLARIPGSAHAIAAGFACGAAVSFTPMVGAHALLSAALALAVRGSIVAALVGTVVGNPWTFPFIWIGTYRLGRWMVAAGGPIEGGPDFVAFFGQMLDAMLSFDFRYLAETAWPVWWPMAVGAVPSAIAAWVGFYLLIRAPVTAYQRRRARWMDRQAGSTVQGE